MFFCVFSVGRLVFTKSLLQIDITNLKISKKIITSKSAKTFFSSTFDMFHSMPEIEMKVPDQSFKEMLSDNRRIAAVRNGISFRMLQIVIVAC